MAGQAFGVQGSLILVSRQSLSDGLAGGDDDSYYPSSSSDGRYVAFSSDADNLSAADDNNFTNVFVRDNDSATTKLISRKSASKGGQGANGSSVGASISGDGRYVAFESGADNLSSADKNAYTNVFVRDTVANTTKLVSRKSASKGGQGANSDSYIVADYAPDPTPGNPLSSNGRYIAFTSYAGNLSDNAKPDLLNVFVRDTVAKTTKLVSRKSASKGGQGANGPSDAPSLSANGRYVAFMSVADNLSSADSFGDDVFVRDTQAKTTRLISRKSASDGGEGANGSAWDPAISSDGADVAFASSADNLSTADDDAFTNIFVRDIAAAQTTLVSRQSESDGGSGGNGDSIQPAVSAHGTYVAFASYADNLSTADNDAFANIFFRDTGTSVTSLVSRQNPADGGIGANGSSFIPSISADGRFVAFESDADNLSAADNNLYLNVFRHQALP